MMIEFLSLTFIIIACMELYLGYKIISKSDPFTWLSLICIRFIFDFVFRPFTFIFIENYEPILSRQVNKGIIHIADAPFYALLTIILNDIAFFCVLLGSYFFIKRKKYPTTIKIRSKSTYPYLYIGLFVFLIGLVFWYWVMQSSGGILNALISLGTGRQNLFRVGGSTIPFEISKHFLSAGIFLISSFFFLKKKVLFAWATTISLFVLLLTFGGRGLAMAAIISGLIAHNYLYKRIHLRTLVILFAVSLPLLIFLKDARRLLDGETELRDVDFLSAFQIQSESGIQDTLVDLSYVSHAFDYDMAFHYSYFEKNKDFFLGEYILGLGMILPRSVFPNKGNTLSNKLSEEIWCDGIGCKIDVGISPSMVTSAAAYWTYFAFPVLCFFIGYCGMLFWHQTVRVMNTPISLMVYSLGWPYVFTLFNDLNSFIASVLPILFTYFFVKILYEFPWSVLFMTPKESKDVLKHV